MLSKIQKQFASDIVSRKAHGDYAQGAGFNPDELIQVYSNNYYLSLIEALEITYPALIKLVGAEFFKYIARKFIKEHPHQSGDLTMFGAELAEFIKASEDCGKLPYLADVARLEWALEMAYHTQDVKHQDLGLLKTLNKAGYSRLKFSLNPALHLIESEYPVFDIWQFDGKAELDIKSGGQNVLIWKQDFEILAEIIEKPLVIFLHNLLSGKNLEKSVGDLAEFDLSEVLNMLTVRKIIERVYLEQ